MLPAGVVEQMRTGNGVWHTTSPADRTQYWISAMGRAAAFTEKYARQRYVIAPRSSTAG